MTTIDQHLDAAEAALAASNPKRALALFGKATQLELLGQKSTVPGRFQQLYRAALAAGAAESRARRAQGRRVRRVRF